MRTLSVDTTFVIRPYIVGNCWTAAGTMMTAVGCRVNTRLAPEGSIYNSSLSTENTISYPLFADVDAGIYPHAASQYHARPKAKRGIAMLSVDKFPYPQKQTRGNEFIPCSNSICDILKRFHSFKIPAIALIWSKSPHKHSVTRSYRSGKESGQRRNRHCDVINDVPLSLYLTLMTSNVRYASIFHGS